MVIKAYQADVMNPLYWQQGRLMLLDQRQLPQQELWLAYDDAPAVAEAIRTMVVRGAPAIGLAAAYAVVLSLQQNKDKKNGCACMDEDMSLLLDARPTAVNLAWAVQQMRQQFASWLAQPDPVALALHAAASLHQQDIVANKTMGRLGAALIEQSCSVQTHCNAGALATGGYGTALGVIRAAWDAGKIKRVYADETRPWMQGTRLTAYEMRKSGIPVSVVCEGAAVSLHRQSMVEWLIVGADRVAANGDVANKIGTATAALSAREHGVKVMVVAPSSTLDMACAEGNDIVIEHRSADEMLGPGHAAWSVGMAVWNPVFDVTPAAWVDALVTERGVVLCPDREKIKNLIKEK